jgi:hypothetical protein
VGRAGVSMKFKHIEVRGAGKSPSGKTLRFTVHARKDGATLGIIQWRSEWRCYCFEPAYPTVFEHVCLRDIADLIETQTAVHKAAGGLDGLKRK